MKLLPFNLPPYARIQYVSKEAKDHWEPKVRQAATVYDKLEVLSVEHGLRACTTLHVTVQNLEAVMHDYAKRGLIVLPIRKVGNYSGFAHTHPDYVEGKPFTWFCAVSRDLSKALRFSEASEGGDHETCGKLLGYPECCRKFFSDKWAAGYIDPIYQQAEGVDEEFVKNKKDYLIRLNSKTPWQSSSMLRYIGLRVVPHIPCSHSCSHSQEMALKWIELAEKENVQGIENLTKILQFPIEWNAMKGIAYISTPIFKVETNSVPCYPAHIVQKEGTVFPEHAAKGLKFPFNEFMGIQINGCK